MTAILREGLLFPFTFGLETFVCWSCRQWVSESSRLSFFFPRREGSSVHINPAHASWFPGGRASCRRPQSGEHGEGKGRTARDLPWCLGRTCPDPHPQLLSSSNLPTSKAECRTWPSHNRRAGDRLHCLNVALRAPPSSHFHPRRHHLSRLGPDVKAVWKGALFDTEESVSLRCKATKPSRLAGGDPKNQLPHINLRSNHVIYH